MLVLCAAAGTRRSFVRRTDRRREVAERELIDDDQLRHEFEARVAAAPDERTRRLRLMRRLVHGPEVSKRLVANSLAVYEAVGAGAGALRASLRDPDAEVRAAAAYVLRLFPGQVDEAFPALGRLLAGEQVPGVLATAIMTSWALGSGLPVSETAGGFLVHPDEAVRLAAAVVLSRQEQASAPVIEELIACARRGPRLKTAPEVPHSGYSAWAALSRIASSPRRCWPADGY